MKRTSVLLLVAGTSIAALLSASSAFAAQNVANTSQKGSLLIWPAINVNSSLNQDTLIEISNDGVVGVAVQCEYVNERKGRVSFDFFLTAKETASWSVGTRAGDRVQPPPFPTYIGSPTFDDGQGAGQQVRGELICFATDAGGANQVAFNELTGTGTPIKRDNTSSTQPKEGYKYNAWAFIARASGGSPAADDPVTPFRTAGDLVLDGGSEGGTYDACPLYNIVNFMPNGATLGSAPNTFTTFANNLVVVSCNQDLRQDYNLWLTKLVFNQWNSLEASFDGSWFCADSLDNVPLTATKDPTNFNFGVLKTPNARFTVQGEASTQCPGSVATGLLGVFYSDVGINNTTTPTNEIGSNTSGAGAETGFVWWNPTGGAPPPAAKPK